jgi:hypothetical protein
MSWGAPPGGQALPPFRSLSWRTLLRPTTFTPPTVRQVYVKIGYVYLLDYFTFIMFIYMSFRAAQDHNMAAGRDTTLSTSSWTQWEDPTATTVVTSRRHSFSFIRILNCLECRTIVLSCRTYFTFYCRELYWMSCCCVMYILPVLEAPCLRRQPKQAVVKNKKSYIHRLTPHVRGGSGPGAPYIRRPLTSYIRR